MQQIVGKYTNQQSTNQLTMKLNLLSCQHFFHDFLTTNFSVYLCIQFINFNAGIDCCW